MNKSNYKFLFFFLFLTLNLLITSNLKYAFAQEKLLSILPQDTTMIVGINVPKILKQSFAKSLLAEILGDKNIDKSIQNFSSKTSIDPYKNLVSILYVTTSKYDIKSGNNLSAVILHGNFNSKNVVEKVKSDPDVKAKVKAEKVNGFEAVTGTFIEGGTLVSLDENTIAIGSNEIIDIITNVKLGKSKNFTTAQSYAGVINHIDNSNDIWAVFEVSSGFKEAVNKAGIDKGLYSTKAVAVNIGFDNECKLEIVTTLQGKSDTEKANEDFKNIKDILALWAKEVPSVLNVVKNSTLDIKDNSAKLVFKFSSEVMSDIIQLVNKTSSSQSTQQPNNKK